MTRLPRAPRATGPFLLLLLLALLGGVCPPGPLAGQARSLSDREAVDTLLAAANLPGIFDGLAGALQDQIRRMAPELGPGPAFRAREAVDRHFTRSRLHEAAAASLLEMAAPPGTLIEVAGWLVDGPVGEARRIAGDYRPALSFDEYFGSVTDQPPPSSRVDLAMRLARAQGAGPFYLVLAETLRGAAHMTLRVFDPEMPGFVGIPRERAEEVVEAQERQAALILLYRLEPVPDELLRAMVDRYESPAGGWYVDALSRAMTDAVLSAAERVTAELVGPPPEGQ